MSDREHKTNQEHPPQPFLPLELPRDQAQPMPQVYREGRYTLEQVPEPTQTAIIALRGAGYSVQDVAQLLRVHNKTVMAVDRYRPDEIATRKEITAAVALEAADLGFAAVRDRLASPDELKKEKVKDIALAAAISADKGLLLAGEATHKVAVSFEDPGHAAFLQELSRMGLGAGTAEQKGAEPVDVEGVEVSELAFTNEADQKGARDE